MFYCQVTKANVEVEPYAFTTTTLYLGHLEYETIRYQVNLRKSFLTYLFTSR